MRPRPCQLMPASAGKVEGGAHGRRRQPRPWAPAILLFGAAVKHEVQKTSAGTEEQPLERSLSSPRCVAGCYCRRPAHTGRTSTSAPTRGVAAPKSPGISLCGGGPRRRESVRGFWGGKRHSSTDLVVLRGLGRASSAVKGALNKNGTNLILVLALSFSYSCR